MKEVMQLNCKNCDRREILQDTAPHLVESISAYRAGYIAMVSIVVLRCFLLSMVACCLLYIMVCNLITFSCAQCGRQALFGE